MLDKDIPEPQVLDPEEMGQQPQDFEAESNEVVGGGLLVDSPELGSLENSDVLAVAEELCEESPASESNDSERREQQRRKNDRRQRGGAEGTRDLMLCDVPERAVRVAARLREHLIGLVEIEVIDQKLRFLLDWTGESLMVSEGEKPEASDCTITLGSEVLQQIERGVVNPQIAMLSHRIEVKGRMDMAVYVFNLIASE